MAVWVNVAIMAPIRLPILRVGNRSITEAMSRRRRHQAILNKAGCGSPTSRRTVSLTVSSIVQTSRCTVRLRLARPTRQIPHGPCTASRPEWIPVVASGTVTVLDAVVVPPSQRPTRRNITDRCSATRSADSDAPLRAGVDELIVRAGRRRTISAESGRPACSRQQAFRSLAGLRVCHRAGDPGHGGPLFAVAVIGQVWAAGELTLRSDAGPWFECQPLASRAGKPPVAMGPHVSMVKRRRHLACWVMALR